MDGISGRGTVAVALYVRSDLPGPSQHRAEAVLARLRALSGDGPVGDLTHETWPKRVPVARCDSAVRDVYLAWSDWARDAGVALQPYFDTRECYCPEAEDYTDWLVVPAIAMSVRVDGDLAAVYPHEDGDATVSVEDGIDALVGTDKPTTEPPVSVAD
jgi:hypothetical protein